MSDNGKEFIATVVVDLMKESNPNCYLVTGPLRTPRDQGSVESANKLVQQVLKSISSENRLRSKEVNWTKRLGQVMSVCNSHSGIQKNSVLSYEAVFCERSFHWAGVSLCATTEEGHLCCRRIEEIFWLNLLSRNLPHRYVYI